MRYLCNVRKPLALLAILVLAFISTVVGCRSKPRIQLGLIEQNPPSFNLLGDGSLAYFMVLEVPPENGCEMKSVSFEQDALWKIKADKVARYVDVLSKINYGEVPDGYVQESPKNGKPAPLIEGKLYFALAFGMPEGDGKLFIIRNGKPIEVQAGNCPSDVPNK
jgi:hypothetical protein